LITARLSRYESTHHGTFGRLGIGDLRWHTVERQWLDNAPNVSCIPCGVYVIRQLADHYFTIIGGSVALYRADMVSPAVTRHGVGMHAANLATQVKGCIAPGVSRGALGDVPAVISSGQALSEIAMTLNGESAQLIISWTA